jgi:hypothetical protein
MHKSALYSLPITEIQFCPPKMKTSGDAKTTACNRSYSYPVNYGQVQWCISAHNVKSSWFAILFFGFHSCRFRPYNNYPRLITVTTTLRISFLHTSFCVAIAADRFCQTFKKSFIAYLAHRIILLIYLLIYWLFYCSQPARVLINFPVINSTASELIWCRAIEPMSHAMFAGCGSIDSHNELLRDV